MKILIVEDNEKNLKLFRLIVSFMGHEAITATDGEGGIRVAKEALPDLILMDIQLPGIDGISALKALRADEKTKDIPAIALTSYAMKGDREHILREGFVDYIAKPIEKDTFMEAVRKALEGGD